MDWAEQRCTRRALLTASALLPLAACVSPRLSACGAECEAPNTKHVTPMTTGIDRPDELVRLLGGKRTAILTHAAGIDRYGRRSIDVLRRLPGVELSAIWSPEHGLSGQAAAGDLVGDALDAESNLYVFSLYGKNRRPSRAMLEMVDAIFIDLQDVGARPYTYISTIAEILSAAGQAGKAVILNDRPNPLGGEAMEGPVLDPKLASFIGVHPVPLRHGMTIGELAKMINVEAGHKASLTVMPVGNWQRGTLTADIFNPPSPSAYALPFEAPSPNLRSTDAILAYAGTVLVEGTTLSEGRGTEAPFEMIGAPFLEAAKLRSEIPADLIPGATLEVVQFTPTTSKYKGEGCRGLRIRNMSPPTYEPVSAALTLIAALHKLYPDKVTFLPAAPGKAPFFDLLIGQDWVRDAILKGTSVADMESRWKPDLAAFAKRRVPYLLYT